MNLEECNTKTLRHEDTKSVEIKATEKNHPIYKTEVINSPYAKNALLRSKMKTRYEDRDEGQLLSELFED